MKKILTILLFFICFHATATDYFVSNAGSDAADGLTTGTAWLTISKVNGSSFNPGDNIFFRRGDMWREQLTIPSSGSAGNLITFGAYGAGVRPIINGANVVTGWTNAGSNQWWVNNLNPVTTRAMVVLGGVIYLEQTSLAAVNSANEYFIDVSATPDRVYVFSTVDPASLIAEISARDYCIITAAGASSKRFIEVDDIEVRYAGRAGIYFEGPGSGIGDALDGSSIVRRCVAYANRIFGIAHYDHYDNLTVEDCDASYNGNHFYSWQADEGTFRRCTSANSIFYGIGANVTDGHSVGGYQTTNWLVEYCVSNNDADAIHLDAGGISSNAIIRYNKVYNTQDAAPVPTPCMGVGSVGVGGVVSFYYNLLVNGASAGFECYTTILGTVNFFNNTIYLNTSSGQTDGIFLANGSNFVFRNNLVTKDFVSLRRVFQVVGSNAPTLSNNEYYVFNNAEHFRASFNSVNYTTLGTWQAGIGGDANSLNSDPLFVNVLSDWSIQTGSPCINAGVDVGLTQDINGNPIVGLPDIGAYEFVTNLILHGRKIIIP